MDEKIIKIELEDEIDLHHFHPQDAKAVLQEFLEIAAQKGKKEVRIVHGKGQSVLKRMVSGELAKNERILSFRDEPGNWGATIAILK